MPKTKTNDPGAHHASSGALIRRFLPYLANYKMVLCLDLFCAALTTLCDIVLPKIMSIITNSAMGVGITLTAGIVLKLAALYFVLRIIDGAGETAPADGRSGTPTPRPSAAHRRTLPRSAGCWRGTK